MSRFLFLLVLLIPGSGFADDEWMPPENPSPTVILREATADARSGNYERALAKHVWYHENALKIDDAEFGVRLSFALSYWLDLAKQYPPALEKLKEIRDATRAKVLESNDPFESFSDVAAIDRVLKEDAKTIDLFQTLDKNDPAKAKQVFRIAKRALIAEEEYELYLKYVDAKRDFEMLARNFEQLKKLNLPGLRGGERDNFYERQFANESATLVAILVKGGKKDEAQTIAVAAKQKLDDTEFHQALADALEGVVPDPWP